MYNEFYDWDDDKNKMNFQKHGISFNEAQTVFSDDFAIYLTDDKHSQNEERFIIIGKSARSNLLLVCYCERDKDNDIITRIISARKATNPEENWYYGGMI